jgi:hypothetical protein
MCISVMGVSMSSVPILTDCAGNSHSLKSSRVSTGFGILAVEMVALSGSTRQRVVGAEKS